MASLAGLYNRHVLLVYLTCRETWLIFTSLSRTHWICDLLFSGRPLCKYTVNEFQLSTFLVSPICRRNVIAQHPSVKEGRRSQYTLSSNRSFVNWLQISLYLCWYCNISGCKREWLWIYENHVCELRIKTWIWKRSWAVVQIRPDKNSGLHGIWTYDLYDTGAVLCCTGTPLHRYRRGPMMGSNTIQALVFCYDLFSLLLK